jgi:hypothetical protein
MSVNNIEKSSRIANNTGKEFVDISEKNKRLDPNSSWDTGGGILNGTGDPTGTPVLASEVVSGTSITITGSLNSAPNSTFVLEFFGNSQPAVPGTEQGEQFLGTITVTTDANGNYPINATFNAVYGSYVSATATGTTDGGYTSQFSAYVPISMGSPASPPSAASCGTTSTEPACKTRATRGSPAFRRNCSTPITT